MVHTELCHSSVCTTFISYRIPIISYNLNAIILLYRCFVLPFLYKTKMNISAKGNMEYPTTRE